MTGQPDRAGGRRPGPGGQRLGQRRPAHRAAAAPGGRRGAGRPRCTVPGSRVGLDSPLRVVAAAPDVGAATRRYGRGRAAGSTTCSPASTCCGSRCWSTYPLLLAVLALIAWRVIGAALRPVEELRSAAERISGSGRDERLPVPASGDEIHALAVTLNSMLDRLAAARAAGSGLRRRRRPRAAQPAGLDADPARGGRAAGRGPAPRPRTCTPRSPDGGPGRGPAGAGPARRRRRAGRARSRAGRVCRAGSRRRPVRRRAGAGRRRGRGSPTGSRARAPEDLRRALANLVDNAVRHARTRCRGRAVRRDGASRGASSRSATTAPGIPAAERDRVFERFTRLDEARDRDAGGSGLGLAIVRELVRAHGGEVRLGDAPGGGLRVELTLPSGEDHRQTGVAGAG